MKHISILFITFLLFSCKEKQSKSEIEDSKFNFPTEFIKPQNIVSTKISKNEEEILETLTNFEMINQFDDCADENVNKCKGYTTNQNKIFINITNDKREISFLQNYQYNCQCNEANSLVSKYETIPIDKISRIDTISIITDINNEKLTSLIIYPKFNSEIISEKSIHKYFDKKENKYLYTTDKSLTKDPIIFYTKKNFAIYLKHKLEELNKQTE